MTLTSRIPMSVGAEDELVRRAQAGHAEAREELARRYREPAYLFALQLLGNRDDALDTAQDAMMRFFNRLGRFDPRRPVRPWLFRIVRNRAYDLWRRRRARPTDSLDDGAPSLASQIADRRLDPEQDALRRDLQRRVWTVVERLPAKKREILILRDYHDLTYREIAGVLGIPQGTVMSRLHAARRALREELVAAGWAASEGLRAETPAAPAGRDTDE